MRDPVRHLAAESLLNFLHNVPSSGRFDKLTNPVDASRESCRKRANFDRIPSALQEEKLLSQGFAKEQALGCVNSPPQPEAGQDAESRSLGSIVLRSSAVVEARIVAAAVNFEAFSFSHHKKHLF